MDPTKQFDKGHVVSTKSLGFEEDFTVHLQRNYEGGWIANCPECGLAEIGETQEEALQQLVDNLKLQNKPKFKI